MKVLDNYVLISLDVISLFTNISCHTVLDNLYRSFISINRKSKIPFVDILHAEFIFNKNFFFFRKHYQQIFGTPMGSLNSPVFAVSVMEDLEIVCLQKFKEWYDYAPLFYFGYVDNTLFCARKELVIQFVRCSMITLNIWNLLMTFRERISWTSPSSGKSLIGSENPPCLIV